MNKPTLLTSPEHMQEQIKYKSIQMYIIKNSLRVKLVGAHLLY